MLAFFKKIKEETVQAEKAITAAEKELIQARSTLPILIQEATASAHELDRLRGRNHFALNLITIIKTEP